MKYIPVNEKNVRFLYKSIGFFWSGWRFFKLDPHVIIRIATDWYSFYIHFR